MMSDEGTKNPEDSDGQPNLGINPFANMYADHVKKVTQGKMPPARSAKGVLKPPTGQKTHRIPKKYEPVWKLPEGARPTPKEKIDMRTPESRSLSEEFGTVVRSGESRTGFQRDRVGFYLPGDLETVFERSRKMQALAAQGEMGRKLIDAVRALYDTLPDKDANASPRETQDYVVNGRAITSLRMSKETAVRQVKTAKAKAANQLTDDQIVRRLSGAFTPKAIRDVLDNRGNALPERRLVARILTVIGPAREIG